MSYLAKVLNMNKNDENFKHFVIGRESLLMSGYTFEEIEIFLTKESVIQLGKDIKNGISKPYRDYHKEEYKDETLWADKMYELEQEYHKENNMEV